jgi:hypothetical protein
VQTLLGSREYTLKAFRQLLESVRQSLKELNEPAAARGSSSSQVPGVGEGQVTSKEVGACQRSITGTSLPQVEPPLGNASRGKRKCRHAPTDMSTQGQVYTPDMDVGQRVWTAEMLERAVWSMCTLPNIEGETCSKKARKRAKQ